MVQIQRMRSASCKRSHFAFWPSGLRTARQGEDGLARSLDLSLDAGYLKVAKSPQPPLRTGGDW